MKNNSNIDNALIDKILNITTYKNNIIYRPKVLNLEQLKSKLEYYKEKHFKAVKENNQLLQCYLSDLIFDIENKIRIQEK